MNIAGVMVHARPEKVAQVVEALCAIEGVEVHARGEDGRLVVTVEEKNESGLADTFVRFNDLPGVLSAAMIYHEYDEE